MRHILILALLACTTVPSLASQQTTRGGEIICTRREALPRFVTALRQHGADALGKTPGCILAQPGLVMVELGSAGLMAGIGRITRVRTLSFADREFFYGFTTAAF